MRAVSHAPVDGVAAGRRRVRIARGIWGLGVPAVLLVPLLLSLRAGSRGDLVIEMSLTAGLLAASLLAVVVVAASRVRSINRAFGIERVLVSHRWLGITTLVTVLVHLGLVPADDPGNVRLVLGVDAPPRARAATGATVALLVLCGAAVLRRRVWLEYETWRRLHVALAAAALVLTGLLADVLPTRRDRACTDVFVCGSAPMVAGVLAGLEGLGVPAERVHTEQFDMV